MIFEPTHKNDDSFLYEEDLTTDQRKDYEPSINRGKHRFVAQRAKLNLDWTVMKSNNGVWILSDFLNHTTLLMTG